MGDISVEDAPPVLPSILWIRCLPTKTSWAL